MFKGHFSRSQLISKPYILKSDLMVGFSGGFLHRNVHKCIYLNNIVEQDHRFIKKRIVDGLGFKEFESAKRTLAGIEMIHMIKKEQLISNRKSMFKSFYSLAS